MTAGWALLEKSRTALKELPAIISRIETRLYGLRTKRRRRQSIHDTDLGLLKSRPASAVPIMISCKLLRLLKSYIILSGVGGLSK